MFAEMNLIYLGQPRKFLKNIDEHIGQPCGSLLPRGECIRDLNKQAENEILIMQFMLCHLFMIIRNL